ncbi:hypothetical protein LZ906_003390 [Paraclostridium ghonii]|uniref:hypothetical protein n=1 Tax=Paraclostridium ghonii TaxID=29358 RepID=UPI00202CB97C|nr:hypothetical protein [Paeniclostridium ghonii]MCM0165892.1 hypothetical protein [Paeniclostridium ghonii]
MNRRRNIYRGMNRRRNHMAKGITIGLVVVGLVGGSFFIRKSDFSFTEKISSLNIFNKKDLAFKEFSYKDIIGKSDDTRGEAKAEKKENKKETEVSNLNNENAKVATVKDWGVYSIQIAAIDNEQELKQIQNKLTESKVPFSIVEIDKVKKVQTYPSFKEEESRKNLEVLKKQFPDAFVTKLEIPMLSLQYTEKYAYVENICKELNNLITNFEEESKVFDKSKDSIDKANYKNIIGNRIAILEKVEKHAKEIDYDGMKGFKENLLQYTESIKEKSKNSLEMAEKEQYNISESLLMSSMQGYYSFVNSIKAI